jgi:hypothetical protein
MGPRVRGDDGYLWERQIVKPRLHSHAYFVAFCKYAIRSARSPAVAMPA